MDLTEELTGNVLLVLDKSILTGTARNRTQKGREGLVKTLTNHCKELISYLSEDRLHESCKRLSGKGAPFCSDGVDYEAKEVIDLFSYSVIDSYDQMLFRNKERISGDWLHDEQLGFMFDDNTWEKAENGVKDAVRSISGKLMNA